LAQAIFVRASGIVASSSAVCVIPIAQFFDRYIGGGLR